METAPVPRDTHGSQEDDEETPVEPIMEAPDVTATSREATSWNPAQGDRSFGYGSGGRQPTTGHPAAEQGDQREDAS